MTWWKWCFVVLWTFMIIDYARSGNWPATIGWSAFVLMVFLNEYQASVIHKYQDLIEHVLKKMGAPKL